VEGTEYEVVLRAELPATSELKAKFDDVCFVDSFRVSTAQAQGLCSSAAASESKPSKIFPNNQCLPVTLNPLVAIFLFLT